jgi:molybdenum cofactor guanylyltransferase
MSAFVLAGGRSSRMGADKALLELDGETLLARTMDCAQSVAVDVGIVGSASRFNRYGTVVEDVFNDCGPLGGIHAALRASRTEQTLILAVDLPGVTPVFLEFLARVASQEPSALAVVPEYAGRWHPLCAVYRREFAQAAEQALKQHRFRIDALFEVVPTRKIAQAELEAGGFGADIFRNLNTMADFEAARSIAQSK